MTAAACRKKLHKLRDEFALRAAQSRFADADALEWARLSDETKMLLLLAAGADGELRALAGRDWNELPDTERAAVRVQVRALRAELTPLYALVRAL